MVIKHHGVFLGLVALFMICGMFFRSLNVRAQEKSTDWTTPVLLYASDLVERPSLVSDGTGALHVVWFGRTVDQPEDTPRSVMYTRWAGGKWTQPTDIVADPMDDFSFPEVAVDVQGVLHMIWNGRFLYYTQAPVWSAEHPQAWREPEPISAGKNPTTPPTLVIAPNADLHVVFSAEGRLYHMVSSNHGLVWSDPTLVFDLSPDTVAYNPRLAVDSDGGLHIVWTEGPLLGGGYPPSGEYYAVSKDGGVTWSSQTELAGADYGQGNIIVAGDGVIHVIYNGRVGVGGKYHRQSLDGGLTWSTVEAILPPGVGGFDGIPGLTVDALGHVYFVGAPSASVSERNDRGWTQAFALTGLLSVAAEYSEQPSQALVTGNQWHVVFWEGRKRLWHTSRLTDAPALPVAPYPTVAVAVTPTSAVHEVISSPTPARLLTKFDKKQTSGMGPTQSLIIGAGLSLVVVVSVLVATWSRRKTWGR